MEFPAVITVETNNRRVQLDRQEQRQRARRLLCGVAMLIIVTVAAFGTMALVHRLRRYHRKVKTITFGRMCVCLCDFRHTNQPTALKLWHNIPHVIIKFLPFFYISLRFLCNFEEQLCKNEWR